MGSFVSPKILILILVLAGVGAALLIFGERIFRTAFPLPEEVMKIGVMRNPSALDPAWEGFKKGMEELGYREGENVVYYVSQSGNNLAETKLAVEELLKNEPDLLYTMGVLTTRAAKEVTSESRPDLPVVFGVVSDPVGGKLVEGLTSSGNNLTGVNPANELLSSKRLELFLEMVPGAQRVIFPWNDARTSGIEGLREAARTLKVGSLVEERVANPAELDKFLSSFAFRSGDVLFRATDSVTAARVRDMIEFALQKRLPFSGTNSGDVISGALMSYGANYEVIGRQAARLADSVLKGAKPSDLPIEGPLRLELAVNLKTAAELGLQIKDEFLAKTDLIIR